MSAHDQHMLSRIEPPQWFVASFIWNDETCKNCGHHFQTGDMIGDVGEFRGQPQYIHESCYRTAMEENA